MGQDSSRRALIFAFYIAVEVDDEKFGLKEGSAFLSPPPW